MHIDDLLRMFEGHAEAGIFLVVLAKRLGVPLPVVPFLLVAGARGLHDVPFALEVLALATLASVIADGLWYFAGRRYGRGMLRLVCRISLSPDTCIRKSELAFAGRGGTTVAFGKFLPGVGGLVPPLAGALGMDALRFTLLNLAGSAVWTGTVLALGLLFHEQVTQALAMLQELGNNALPILLVALVAWLGWLALRRLLVTMAALKLPRIAPEELAERIERGESVLVLDVRGTPLAMQGHLPGALYAASEGKLMAAAARAPADMDLVAYCDCPNDVSAARLAEKLRRRGRPTIVLAGGYSAWVAQGLPVHGGRAAAKGVRVADEATTAGAVNAQP